MSALEISEAFSIFNRSPETRSAFESSVRPRESHTPVSNRTHRSDLTEDLPNPIKSITGDQADNVVQLPTGERRRLAARLRALKRLPEDHDGEGAKAPIGGSVDAALAFLPGIQSLSNFGVTIDDDGHAVIEFSETSTGAFISLTFMGQRGAEVEFYKRAPGVPSILIQAPIEAPEVSGLLVQAGIVA